MRNGTGTFVSFKNGFKEKYQGKWLDDMKHGQGKMKTEDGDSVIGTWYFDNLNGVGKLKKKN
jgi:hypothetical protein